METLKLKRFAQYARRSLLEQVSAKLKLVLAAESSARREHAAAVKKLEEAIQKSDKEQVIERVAYIWFNRFCALRFMDVNRYNRVNVVSPADPGQFQPEILAEAKMGHIDEEMVHDKVRQQIFALLAGIAPSRDSQGEAYRLLVVAACNFWNKAMPFLFQRIDDYTELLMPDDLLSGNSILAYTREAMTPDACGAGSNQVSVISNQQENSDSCRLKADGLAAAGGVEVIGWLYQFYISEKKDEVFDGLKKNKKITPENIPAATQLFTPHWIVRYLVENSLGRLWMQNRPNSRLKERMDYYIEPQMDTNGHRFEGNEINICVNLCESVVQISSPEEIKICDPACGSGHMLTYAFDLLYAIYEEEGYEPAEIPEKILTNNLFGIEIDERAGELAAFALTMKARSKQRRFFNKGVKPNICVLENVHFDEGELGAVVSNQLSAFSKETRSAFLHDMKAFEEADNFGSLIRPTMTTEQIAEVEGVITDYCKLTTDIFERAALEKVLQALRQADYLSPKYHVVIANPPYKKKADLNDNLQGWLESSFVDGKYDLYQAFILRNAKLAVGDGYVAMITMQGWMFAPRYEAIRSNILTNCSILSMAQLGERAFDSIGGEVVSTTAFVLSNNRSPSLKGQFVRLTEGKNEDEKNQALLSAAKNPNSDIRFSASDDDFLIIPGQPLVFWASEQVRLAFHNCPTISEYIVTREGLTTGSNALFLREWHEVSQSDVAYGMDNEVSAQESNKRWFPYVKGGGSRRWYGNFEHFVNWFDDGVELKNFKDEKTGRIRSHNYNGIYGFRAGFTWSGISSNDFAVRDVPVGFMFDAKGPMGFVNSSVSCEVIEAFLNSKVSSSFLRMLAPTLDFKLTHVLSLPLKQVDDPELSGRTKKSVYLAKADWDSFETSWDFIGTPLLNPDCRQPTLKAT